MRLLLAALIGIGASAAGPAAQAPPPPGEAPPAKEERVFTVLHAGTYECVIEGMMCEACATAIGRAVSAVAGVRKARADFEKGLLTVTVAARKTVRITAVERALRRAAERMNLGGAYRIKKIRYIP